jgi:cytochrome bd ubiquinol oxidase subunit I
MVGIGTAMIALGLWFGITWWRKRDIPKTPWFLRIVAVFGIAAIVAMEAGWIVTEVGRQPWIVYNILRTKDAVTTAGGVPIMFAAILLIYATVGTIAILVIRGMTKRWRDGEDDEGDVPYGPPGELPA